MDKKRLDQALWKHQGEGIKRAMAQDHFAFFFDVGAGKSRTVLEVLRRRYNQHGRVMRTLVLAPLVVLRNWTKEFWYYTNVPPHKVRMLKGTGAKRVQNFKKAVESYGDCVIILNYDALQTKDLFEALMEWKPEVLIADESQRVKNHKSKRTKNTYKLSRGCNYRYLLSGTPILNSPADVFGQFLVMDHGKSFGDNFFWFQKKYFVDKNVGMPKQKYFPNWVPRKEMMKVMEEKIAHSSMSVKKKDCLDLPPYIRQTIDVEMEPRQKKAYAEMEKYFITYLEDSACVATLAITKGLRLQQIVTGHVPLDNGGVLEFENCTREKALYEILEDIVPNHKVIVWACFKENYKAIRRVCEKLKVEFVEVTGEVTGNTRYDNVDSFNNDESVRVLIGNPVAAGLGINLVAASYSVFYSRNFSLENDLQAEARCYRGGSEIHESITRIDLVTPGTIDEYILKMLASKKTIGDNLITDYKSFMTERSKE